MNWLRLYSVAKVGVNKRKRDAHHTHTQWLNCQFSALLSNFLIPASCFPMNPTKRHFLDFITLYTIWIVNSSIVARVFHWNYWQKHNDFSQAKFRRIALVVWKNKQSRPAERTPMIVSSSDIFRSRPRLLLGARDWRWIFLRCGFSLFDTLFLFFFSCFSLSPFVLVVSFTTTQHQHHQSTLRWYISISRPHDSISELTESVHLRKFHLKSETNTQMSLWLDEWSKHNFDEYYCLCSEKTQTYNGALFVTGHAHTNTNTHKHTDDARAIAKRDSGPDLRLIHTCQNSSTTQNNCLLGFICLLRCRWQFSHLTMHCWHSL